MNYKLLTTVLSVLCYVPMRAASYIPIECDMAIELYKQDMRLLYQVMDKVYADMAAVPGLTPSHALYLVGPEDFVRQLKDLKTVSAYSCTAMFLRSMDEYDRAFNQVLKRMGDRDLAWGVVQRKLQGKILELSNGVINSLVQDCATIIPDPIVIENNYFMQAEQLGAIE